MMRELGIDPVPIDVGASARMLPMASFTITPPVGSPDPTLLDVLDTSEASV